MNHEQQQLLRKAAENLKAANLLASEGLHDIAVSRAYYSMFYVAETFLLSTNLSFSKHTAVISRFGELFAKTELVPRELHRYLIQAQEARTQADYDAGTTATADEAQIHIERAKIFLETAHQRFGSP